MVKELIEIADFVVIDKLPNGVSKEDVGIQFLGETKVRTWSEYVELVQKNEKKRAKARIKKQLENLPPRVDNKDDKQPTLTAQQIENALDEREENEGDEEDASN